jgi:hypothetical protein
MVRVTIILLILYNLLHGHRAKMWGTVPPDIPIPADNTVIVKKENHLEILKDSQVLRSLRKAPAFLIWIMT